MDGGVLEPLSVRSPKKYEKVKRAFKKTGEKNFFLEYTINSPAVRGYEIFIKAAIAHHAAQANRDHYEGYFLTNRKWGGIDVEGEDQYNGYMEGPRDYKTALKKAVVNRRTNPTTQIHSRLQCYRILMLTDANL